MLWACGLCARWKRCKNSWSSLPLDQEFFTWRHWLSMTLRIVPIPFQQPVPCCAQSVDGKLQLFPRHLRQSVMPTVYTHLTDAQNTPDIRLRHAGEKRKETLVYRVTIERNSTVVPAPGTAFRTLSLEQPIPGYPLRIHQILQTIPRNLPDARYPLVYCRMRQIQFF